jgi:predicted dehydrogenase
MDKLRTAVVGAGKMGEIHARVYSELPQSNLVAIVDVDADKAKRPKIPQIGTKFTELTGRLTRPQFPPTT